MPRSRKVEELRVADVMRRQVVSIAPDARVRELAELLSHHRIGGVPVVDGAGKVVGVVSASDMVRLAAESSQAPPWLVPEESEPGLPGYSASDRASPRPPHAVAESLLDGYRVEDVMMPASFSVREEATLPELARFLLQAGVHRALVLGEGRLRGIVTATDVLRAIGGEAQAEAPGFQPVELWAGWGRRTMDPDGSEPRGPAGRYRERVTDPAQRGELEGAPPGHGGRPAGGDPASPGGTAARGPAPDALRDHAGGEPGAAAGGAVRPALARGDRDPPGGGAGEPLGGLRPRSMRRGPDIVRDRGVSIAQRREDTMQALAEAIRTRVGEIVDRWDEQNRTTEPYLRLRSRDDRLNHLADLITDLAFASLADSGRREVQQTALKSAARHGETRREQGFDPEDLLKEFHLVRYSLWAFIQEHVRDKEAAFKAISRIDQAASISTRASLLGFHRRELEERGLWPRAVEGLLDQPPVRGGQE